MDLTGNTVLITGGGRGIGRALAEMLDAEGNKIIIAGRDPSRLAEVKRAHDSIDTMLLDVADSDSVRSCATEVISLYPSLNVVIHNAGITMNEAVGADDVPVAEAIIATNLLGPIRLTSALLPLLKRQPQSVIMTVSSGLAFLPLFFQPTYSATKAAIHSYTQSLRYQLRDTSVQVIELIPPYLQTSLSGPHQATDPLAMPLPDFITEVAEILRRQPEVAEICVDRVMVERNAEASGNYSATYKQFNDAIAGLIP